MGHARDAIMQALENLSSDELKKFKLKFISVNLREGFGRIPRGQLLSMDAMELSDKLVSYYLDDYSIEITAVVLRDIGMLELARDLEATSKGSGAAPASASAEAKALPLMKAKQAHFVDRHRAALINRVTEVDAVLDNLYGSVLTEEQYQAVRAESTNPNKMRKLFGFAPAWDQNCKDLLLQALRETQSFLVADLENK
ncbi:PREDICTED: apoptosis-associated speck-like protein containing a CARD [Condylura cristata]|uniref:apoptosis-associated speck-like protein containing a CARD n=1 Tax=Condylura cristata TaxID=143302 RepID=UPI0006433D58|nr:PREDICTED: apoptosis-associated speck-like protein containing a CARD [Condylura cristata]